MASGLAARNGGWVGLGALVAVLLLGFGLRVGEAWDGRAPVYDAAAYAAIAANLDQGNGFTVGPKATQPSSNYSPGLPLAVAALYEVTGGVHERLARLVLAALGTLAVLFAYLIARRLRSAIDFAHPSVQNRSNGAIAGVVAALAVAVYPALLEYQGMLMTEPLAATLLSGSVLALLWGSDRKGDRGWRSGWPRWVPSGLLLGALAMVRPEYLGVAVLVAVLVALREARGGPGPRRGAAARGRARLAWRAALASGLAILAGILVVVGPWTIRNAVALHRAVPISTGGGQVLFAGTYLPSNGDPERVGAEVVAENPELFGPGDAQSLRLEQILARLAAHEHPGMEADRALSKMGKEQLWEDIAEEPLEYLGFLATKVGRIWSHGPRAVMREPVWEALHWALLGLGLLGLGLLARRRRWEALLLGAIFLAITAISALLVASPRRVLVMLPLVAALAGVGTAWLGAQGSKLGEKSTDSLTRQ